MPGEPRRYHAPEANITVDVHELLDRVEDRVTFFEFVRKLALDRKQAVELEATNPSSQYGPDAGGWENSTIDSYLEAALAWAEDTETGTTQGFSTTPSWKGFATFLYAGKIYE